MPTTQLVDRSIITVTGGDAATLIQGLVTTDIENLGADEARAGALLTPQGKILCDFLVSRIPDGLRLDVARAAAHDLVRRLTLYRLRAKADIALDDEPLVAVTWRDRSGETTGSEAKGFRDGRFPEALAVVRHYGAASPEPDASFDGWTRLRITNGVAEAGSDFPFGEAFPHDVNMDQTGGVSFSKGCYVGQEVVSRMQHRGTARRRVLVAHGEADLPPPGTAILSEGREIGLLGSTSGSAGLALARIDRAKAALDAGHPVKAGDVPLTLEIPERAGFTWPEAARGSADDS